jgi:hypothetical protein
MATDSGKVEIGIPGVDFAQMAREAIAGQLTQALTASPAMIQTIVAGALTQRVDSEGKARNGYSSDKTFVTWVCEDMIRKAVIDMMKARLEEMRPELEKAVARDIKASAPAIAQALVKSYGESVGHQWNTQIEFTVMPRGR